MDQRDSRILALLRHNARTSVTDMAAALGLSRSTIRDRMARLERDGVIEGYTVLLSEKARGQRVRAHASVKIRPGTGDPVIRKMQSIGPVQAVYTIAGDFDLIAVLTAETTEEIDAALDAIAALDDVERTQSSVILSEKFRRR